VHHHIVMTVTINNIT